MKTLYIHIGANKTGTTAIQSMLDRGRDLLNPYGYSYPEQGKIWRGHFKLAWEIGAGGSSQQQRDSQGSWCALADHIAESHAHTFIVSSENLVLVNNPEQLEAVKEALGDNIKVMVVLFVRRQDLWVESLYLQAIKMGVDVPDFLSYSQRPGQQIDFMKILYPWEQVFGSDNILVRSYDEQKHDLLECFLRLVGLDGAGTFPEVSENPSLTRGCAEMMLMYRAHLWSKERRDQFVDHWNRYISHNDHLTPRFFDRRQRSEFLDQFTESNRKVAQMYLRREELFDLTDMPDGVMYITEAQRYRLHQQYVRSLLDSGIVGG